MRRKSAIGERRRQGRVIANLDLSQSEFLLPEDEYETFGGSSVLSIFKSKTIDGQRYAMDHLDPFLFGLTAGDNEWCVRVEFRCHCFTEALKNHHSPDMRYSHEGELRAFSLERYRLSFVLPNMIRSLGSKSVYRSLGKNYFVLRQDAIAELPGVYLTFFHVHKARKSNVDVQMIVESAYLKPAMTERASPVRFTTLIDKTAQGLDVPRGPIQTTKRK